MSIGMGLWERAKRLFVSERIALDYGALISAPVVRGGPYVNVLPIGTNRIVSLGASQAINQADHDGRILLMNLAGGARTYTLPASAGTGARFKFYVNAVNTSNYLIKVANASDVMAGGILSAADGGSTTNHFDTAATDDTITLNGTTTGGVNKGDWVELVDIATNVWAVTGVVSASGTEATMFSATV